MVQRIEPRTNPKEDWEQAAQWLSENKGWVGPELELSTDWRYTATSEEIAHLEKMVRKVAGQLNNDANKLPGMSRQNFDLGPFGERLDEIMSQVRDGVGVALYRSLPLDKFSLLETAIIYWAMGLYIGQPMSNNGEGDMIGHVVDAGEDYNDPRQRGYQTNATMDYHCDQTDVVTLLCINTAKSGGTSKLSSSIAIYHELMRRQPELVEILRQPYCWTKHSEKNDGESNYYESPVFNYKNGRMSTSFGPHHMIKGHALPEAPDMTSEQKTAIDFMHELAEELHAEMSFKRGDIQFANNYTVLHTREAFEDWPEPRHRRMLWRLWLAVPNFLPSTPYSEQWKSGVDLSSVTPRIELVYPE